MNDNKMITQSRIIEEYGWTKSLISKFLPDPVLKANPHYRKAAPMRLWDEDTVKQEMTKGKEFALFFVLPAPLRTAAQQAHQILSRRGWRRFV